MEVYTIYRVCNIKKQTVGPYRVMIEKDENKIKIELTISFNYMDTAENVFPINLFQK